MSCTDCTNNSPVTFQSWTTVSNCGGCTDCGCEGATMDSKCVFYTGPNLACSQVNTNDSLEDALMKIDQKVCTSLGNYASYNKYCLDNNAAITTEQQFVETISEYVCDIRTDFDTFINLTFANYQNEVDIRITALEFPGITCASAGVGASDGLLNILEKYCNKFSDLDDALDLSGVNWDSCYSVNPDPTTLTEAFNVLISQICGISGGSGAALPTFNNTGSCLSGTLTSSDSLVDTVTKIRDRLCEVSIVDVTALDWGCFTAPTIDPTDLQSTLNAILAQLQAVSQTSPTFSNDFSVSYTDNDNLCAGVTVALAPSSNEDKFVAVDNDDVAPGTLVQKLQAGVGVTLDAVTEPGKLIINSSGGSASDVKVKVRSADPTGGFLEDKVEGTDSGDGIEITKTTNTVDNKVTIGATIDFEVLWTKLLDFLDANPTAKSSFCERVQDCLPDCIIPPNVTVIYQDTNQTTSTTTTTTTTL